jgi:hypothetical protein
MSKYDPTGIEAQAMTQIQLVRISALALTVGAVIFIAHLAARSLLTAGADPVSAAEDSHWALVNTLGALGATFVLRGLPGMYARVSRPAGPVSSVSGCLPLPGYGSASS